MMICRLSPSQRPFVISLVLYWLPADLSYYIRGVFVDVWSPISIFGSLLAFIGTHTASPTKPITSRIIDSTLTEC